MNESEPNKVFSLCSNTIASTSIKENVNILCMFYLKTIQSSQVLQYHRVKYKGIHNT